MESNFSFITIDKTLRTWTIKITLFKKKQKADIKSDYFTHNQIIKIKTSSLNSKRCNQLFDIKMNIIYDNKTNKTFKNL